MSTIVEFSLASEKLSFAASLSATPLVELDVEREYGIHSVMPVVFCWARGGDLDAFEAALADDETVTDVNRLGDSGGRRLYRAKLTGATSVVTYDVWMELGAARLEWRYANGRWYARMRFPDREALIAFREFCNENDLDFQLDRLYDTDPERGPSRDRLTSRQRETLRLANERGYFEIPRAVTLTDLADELGVSNQAVSERLRRGCGRVVDNHFT